MFGISLPELLVIMAVLLIVVGPERLPEVARKVGGITGDLKRRADAARREFYNSFYKPLTEAELEIRSASRSLLTSSQAPLTTPPIAPTPPTVEATHDCGAAPSVDTEATSKPGVMEKPKEPNP